MMNSASGRSLARAAKAVSRRRDDRGTVDINGPITEGRVLIVSLRRRSATRANGHDALQSLALIFFFFCRFFEEEALGSSI
jgi:hypothetical protein